ncbi:DUF2877 domain-containing protein [Acidaminobacter sp. JC074]|uniref:DUF2877 domain-containing protein n=1 Tax=Acidaminobacter sp. JC074 TaxID=2530199 RepID=UPI001F0CE23E|nr:DUF2877 domain-containing protein [Acidaminobacter sp. JC074]MCH4887795.1 DUF2877 domain-containing protein [Acidaminobacter sp. JC074]
MIDRMTKCLYRYLDEHENLSGVVHSVFENAFNILDENDRLIGIISHDKDLGPMSMQFTEDKFSKIVQGEKVRFHQGQLEVDTSYFRYENLELVDLSLSRYELTDIKQKLKDLENLIINRGSSEGISGLIYYFSDELSFTDVSLNEYSDFIKERLILLIESIQDEDWDLFLSIIPKVIGFGPGLTPSTDDFLSGIITIIFCLSLVTDDMLKKIFHACKNRTTKISEEMLYHAVHGHVSESYKEFIEELFDDENDDILPEVTSVLNVGSTSGTDFLFGVYMMASLMIKKEANNDQI